MKNILLIILLGISLFLVGCSTETTLDKIIKKDNYQIVDVRTSTEYNESHLKGAINIPYDEIDSNTNLDKNKIILVYCKSGVRSNKAYNTLKSLGYDAYDLGAYNTIDLEKE